MKKVFSAFRRKETFHFDLGSNLDHEVIHIESSVFLNLSKFNLFVIIRKVSGKKSLHSKRNINFVKKEMDEPLILVTNDDGINAKGIRSLVESVKDFGKVVVVAPDKPQSGMGHAITVNQPLRMRPYPHFDDIEAYSCSGTPVDCVKLAIYEILERRPDVLVSGVNHGANCSTNVLYSGTMSAAVEGALEEIPSIGFSLLDFHSDADFSLCKEAAKEVTQSVIKQGMPHGTCLNVNIPKLAKENYKGLKVCRQARAFWEDTFEKRVDPMGHDYYWLTGSFASEDKGEDTDLWALEQGYTSIVPTQFDMTAHHAIAELNTWNLK